MNIKIEHIIIIVLSGVLAYLFFDNVEARKIDKKALEAIQNQRDSLVSVILHNDSNIKHIKDEIFKIDSIVDNSTTNELDSMLTTLTKDSICFSIPEAKIIFKDLKKLTLCDSLVVIQDEQIITYKLMVKGYRIESDIYTTHIVELTNDINKVNLRLKATKTIASIGIPSAIIGGFIAGFIINK